MIASIFLGPSLPIEEARGILPGAVFHPPAEQGDLLAAVDHDGAEILGLIDGTFHQNLSVWHNEVCYLLSRGITVYGASSMGALRAAETSRFGTVGVGSIYAWYRDGVITADDEVALLHGDESSNFRPLSEPLVNLRASVARAVAEGLLDDSVAHRVIDLARSIYYPERRLPLILQRCQESGILGADLKAVERALTVNYVDLKRADAREMLLEMARVLNGSVPVPKPPPFEFARSSMFETLYNLDRKVRVEDRVISLQDIAEHIALHCPEFTEIRRSALNRDIVVFLSRLLDMRVTHEEIAQERNAFCDERDLNTPEAFKEWLRGNALCEADLMEYLAQEVVCRRLRHWALTARSFDRGCRALLDEVRIRGSFRHWAKEAAEETAIVNAYGEEPEYRHVWSEHPARLAAMHAASGKVKIKGDAKIWAEEAGFEDVEGLAQGLSRATIFNEVRARIARQIQALERVLASLTNGSGHASVSKSRKRRPGTISPGTAEKPKAKKRKQRSRQKNVQ